MISLLGRFSNKYVHGDKSDEEICQLRKELMQKQKAIKNEFNQKSGSVVSKNGFSSSTKCQNAPTQEGTSSTAKHQMCLHELKNTINEKHKLLTHDVASVDGEFQVCVQGCGEFRAFG